MNAFIKALVIASTALFFTACGDDNNAVSSNSATSESGAGDGADGGAPAAAGNTAVDVAKATPSLSILVEAVVAADLAGTLSGDGPFTIFAPTNDAFVALLAELGVSKDQLLADNALLTSVLTYHVVSGTVKKADVPLGKAILPLGGSLFKVDAADDGALTITDGRGRTAGIIATDVIADNAVIHLIDKVILPADMSIVAKAQSLPDFSILVEAVVAADLVGTLSGDGPFTVFAPTNAAFADLLAELGVTKEQLLADKALLGSVLTYHVVPGQVLKADVPVGQPIGTVQGESFTVDSSLAITDQRARMAQIIAADVFTTNGVIHVIDKVILPAAMADPMPPVPPAPSGNSIVDIAIDNPDFSILVEAVVAAGLADTLSGAGPFTVFAPNNAAFVDLLSELDVTKEQLLANTGYLKDVLLYHVLGAKVLAADIPTGTHASSLEGGNFDVTTDGRIRDNEGRFANIVATDIEADNGVIQVIDTVILPYKP